MCKNYSAYHNGNTVAQFTLLWFVVLVIDSLVSTFPVSQVLNQFLNIMNWARFAHGNIRKLFFSRFVGHVISFFFLQFLLCSLGFLEPDAKEKITWNLFGKFIRSARTGATVSCLAFYICLCYNYFRNITKNELRIFALYNVWVHPYVSISNNMFVCTLLIYTIYNIYVHIINIDDDWLPAI